jgi:Ankyrin repeats (3 copies)
MQTVKLLVDADDTVVLKACGAAHETPLHRAVGFHSGVDVVDLLIKSGADVNAATRTGETALMFAKDAANTQLLLEAGAAVNARCMLGCTVLHIAAERGASAGVICSLLKAGADATATDAVGNTPAEVAQAWRQSAAAALLQRAEADQCSKQQPSTAAAAALPDELRFSKSCRGWRRSTDIEGRRSLFSILDTDAALSCAHLRQLEFARYSTVRSLAEYADLSAIMQDRPRTTSTEGHSKSFVIFDPDKHSSAALATKVDAANYLKKVYHDRLQRQQQQQRELQQQQQQQQQQPVTADAVPATEVRLPSGMQESLRKLQCCFSGATAADPAEASGDATRAAAFGLAVAEGENSVCNSTSSSSSNTEASFNTCKASSSTSGVSSSLCTTAVCAVTAAAVTTEGAGNSAAVDLCQQQRTLLSQMLLKLTLLLVVVAASS